MFQREVNPIPRLHVFGICNFPIPPRFDTNCSLHGFKLKDAVQEMKAKTTAVCSLVAISLDTG